MIRQGIESAQAIVLAAGKGTRLKCKDLPKVMLPIGGIPMIDFSLDNLLKAGFPKPVVVIGFCGEKIKEHLRDKVIYALQPKRLGTAHAVICAEPKVSKLVEDVLVIMGDDSAFYNPETINNLIELHREKSPSITMLTVHKKDPAGLGRVIRDETDHVRGIVEEKLASPAEKKIKEVNAACYVFKTLFLWPALKKIKRNSTGEYFLTDLIEIANQEGRRVIAHKISSNEWRGINTPEQLLLAHKVMAQRLKKNGKLQT
ncbi:MAG: UDP-N-acetylmuramyl tripeptide synthetase [Candidatus Berkelbacteria bacterium]|nr:UDP-N-acetylmuramyl tripeptide synthetase [Candidatus Berkelbacteria bacterium]